MPSPQVETEELLGRGHGGIVGRAAGQVVTEGFSAEGRRLGGTQSWEKKR